MKALDIEAGRIVLAAMPTEYTKAQYNEHRLQWFAWLRDSENRDKQGRRALVTEDGTFCCLGAAGVCAGVPYGENAQHWHGFVTDTKAGVANGTATLEIQHWLGLRDPDGGFSNRQFTGFSNGGGLAQASSLAALNDAFEWTFYQIANFAQHYAQDLWAEGTY